MEYVCKKGGSPGPLAQPCPALKDITPNRSRFEGTSIELRENAFN